jgi:hypothetical protein
LARDSLDFLTVLLREMGVDHGGDQILIPKQVLNRANVGTTLQQVGGEGMTKGVGADGLRQTSPVDRYHWVHVTVDTNDPDVFRFRPRLVAANLTQRP